MQARQTLCNLKLPLPSLIHERAHDLCCECYSRSNKHMSTATVAEIVKALSLRGTSLIPKLCCLLREEIMVTMQLHVPLATCSRQIGDVCACLMLE